MAGYDEVIVLLDFTSKDERALRAATRLGVGGMLRLIHVMSPGEGDEGELAVIDEARRAAAKQRLEQYVEQLADFTDAGGEVQCEIAIGALGAEVARRVDAPRHSVLVLVPDRADLGAAVPSPRPEAIALMELAASAPCSVLLVR
ncbi:MAG: universal stress protein [Myxococcota bacterium]|nr:universal stress protein [Myxococcota bacterium]